MCHFLLIFYHFGTIFKLYLLKFITNLDFWHPKVVQQHNQGVVGNFVSFVQQIS